MTLCKFFLQGNCRSGDACKFEHRAPRPHESEYNEWRRNNPASFGGQPNVFGGSNTANHPDDTHATRKGWSQQIIFDNLKIEHPSWPFTSFGAPFFTSLIHADLSPEEYHLAAVEATRNGRFSEWVCSLLPACEWWVDGLGQQQGCDSRIQQIKSEEANVLRNLQQAWQYNVNDPYYPTGKTESGNKGTFGSGTSAFGGGTGTGFGGGGGFGQNTQSSFGRTGETLSFGKSSSFGASPFGSMPASAFGLGSRDQASANPAPTFGTSAPSAFGNTTASTLSAFGQPTPTSSFGQPTPAFGANNTPTAFGTNISTFGTGKPSVFGIATGLPAAPLSTTSTATFGQPSVLGATGLPPAPTTMGMPSRPTFGQTSSLGVLGAGSAAPAFGQASSFSSPFAGGLGKALGGVGGTGGGVTFGSKTSFGGFTQGNQPNAFAAAAGQPSAFMQAAAAASTSSTQLSAFQTTSGGGFGDTNRFAALGGEIRGNGDKDDDMADDDVATVVMEPSAPPTTTSTPVMSTSTPLPMVPELTSTQQSLSGAFGGLSAGGSGPGPTPSVSQPGPTPSVSQPGPTPDASQSKPIPLGGFSLLGRGSTSSVAKKPVIDEMAVWRADKFEIGMIPETEPPVQVR